MAGFLERLRAHKFVVHLVAIFLMAIPPVPLYLVARQGAVGWIWGLLSLVILGNILILLVR